MRLGGKSRLVASLAALLLVAACQHSQKPHWTDVPPTENLDRLAFGEITLADGTVMYLSQPRDYGSAYCDGLACVHKADIRRVRWPAPPSDDWPSFMAPLAAPVVAGAFLFYWGATCAQQGCGSGRSDASAASSPPPSAAAPRPAIPPAPRAIPERAPDRWLRSGEIDPHTRETKDYSNPCKPFLPADVTTDDHALDWLSEHRKEILSLRCLSVAVRAMNLHGDQHYADLGVRVDVLMQARIAWEQVNCPRWQTERVVPSEEFRDSSLSQLDVIRETLADPDTLVLPANFAETCEHPADPASIPDRASFLAAIDPFSPPGIAPWLRDRAREY